MIGDTLGSFELHDATPIRDGAYGVPWRQRSLDLSGMEFPTEEYAEYLVSTVWLTLKPLYYVFDRNVLSSNIKRFYKDGPRKSQERTELWHIQIVLVLGLGHSILAKDMDDSGPAGSMFLARAMEALPDGHRLSEDPVLAVEILSLLALFLQAFDMRLAAQQYVRLTSHEHCPSR